MNRHYFAALALLITGCARPKAPAVAVVPTATPIPKPTPIFVPAPVMPTQATPTPDPAEAKRRAVVSRELARLKTASPERDLATAWANKDTRFIGVMGYSLSLPGAPKEISRAAIMRGQVNPIEGTSDAISSPEEAEFNNLAFEYATRYNRLLLQKMNEQQRVTKN